MKQRILISLLLCVLAIPGIAQPRKTVLPYRLVGGKMIVEMIMNGTPRSFILTRRADCVVWGDL